MARADKAREDAARHADYLAEKEHESEAAEQWRWDHLFEHMGRERARELHPSRYIDTRCFAVDGDVDRP
jgi:hypothetical protein